MNERTNVCLARSIVDDDDDQDDDDEQEGEEEGRQAFERRERWEEKEDEEDGVDPFLSVLSTQGSVTIDTRWISSVVIPCSTRIDQRNTNKTKTND